MLLSTVHCSVLDIDIYVKKLRRKLNALFYLRAKDTTNNKEHTTLPVNSKTQTRTAWCRVVSINYYRLLTIRIVMFENELLHLNLKTTLLNKHYPLEHVLFTNLTYDSDFSVHYQKYNKL